MAERQIEKMRNGTLLLRDGRTPIASATFVSRERGWIVRCHHARIWEPNRRVTPNATAKVNIAPVFNKPQAVVKMRECEAAFDCSATA